jgi:hypothetical protein
LARVKKPIDYIERLCFSKRTEQQALGRKLQAQYEMWRKTLSLEDFIKFNEAVMANKTKIGVAQFFGKFRAYAFEEYVYRLLKERVSVKKPLEVFWGEKCLVWQNAEKDYAMEFDISIGRKIGEFIDPTMVFDAKVELDSARLKTALASFAILKSWKPGVKCILVYVAKDLDNTLLDLAKKWVDGVFRFSLEKDETSAFLNYISNCL